MLAFLGVRIEVEINLELVRCLIGHREGFLSAGEEAPDAPDRVRRGSAHREVMRV